MSITRDGFGPTSGWSGATPVVYGVTHDQWCGVTTGVFQWSWRPGLGSSQALTDIAKEKRPSVRKGKTLLNQLKDYVFNCYQR